MSLFKKICVISVLFATSLWAISTEATGYGATLDEAVLQAKREALAMTIGQMVQSKTTVKNFMTENDEIITKTMGFVKSFEILEQKKQGPDSVYVVKIRAETAQDGLKKNLVELGFTIKDIGNPRVAFFIKESNMGHTDLDLNKTSEMTLLQIFKNKGFDVVEANHSLKFFESPEAVKALGGDADASAKIGQQLNAEVIIVGVASTSETDLSKHSAFANSSMKSATATINLKAINVSTGKIIASTSESDSRIHPNIETAGNNALRLVCQKIIEKDKMTDGIFLSNMMKSWQGQINDGFVYTLTLKGIQSYADSKEIQKSLEKWGAINPRGFAKPQLNLEITFMGKLDNLAEKLDQLKIGKIGHLEVENSQGNALTLVLKK
jgi:hypothetical protein